MCNKAKHKGDEFGRRRSCQRSCDLCLKTVKETVYKSLIVILKLSKIQNAEAPSQVRN